TSNETAIKRNRDEHRVIGRESGAFKRQSLIQCEATDIRFGQHPKQRFSGGAASRYDFDNLLAWDAEKIRIAFRENLFVHRWQRFQCRNIFGAWPIEQWSADGKVKLRYLPQHAHYEIPARCLRAASIANLFM